jgi:hypothetical protein
MIDIAFEVNFIVKAINDILKIFLYYLENGLFVCVWEKCR